MKFRDNEAIYLQIAAYVGQNILLGKWPAEQKIPSVRDLAIELEVNLNTVMRSYEFLENLGAIYNKRGLGFFVLPDGFKQDSLSVEQDYGSTVILSNNIIRSVHAVIGKSEGSSSRIILQQTNQFDNASLDIGHRSKLELENCIIHHLDYHLSDNAKLIVKGNAQELLNNLNHFRQ